MRSGYQMGRKMTRGWKEIKDVWKSMSMALQLLRIGQVIAQQNCENTPLPSSRNTTDAFLRFKAPMVPSPRPKIITCLFDGLVHSSKL